MKEIPMEAAKFCVRKTADIAGGLAESALVKSVLTGDPIMGPVTTIVLSEIAKKVARKKSK